MTRDMKALILMLLSYILWISLWWIFPLWQWILWIPLLWSIPWILLLMKCF